MKSIHIVQFAYDLDSDALVASMQSVLRIYPGSPYTIISDEQKPISPRARGYAKSRGVQVIDDSMDRVDHLRGMAFTKSLLSFYAGLDCDYILKIDPDTIITADIIQEMIAAGKDVQFIQGTGTDSGLGCVYVLSKSLVCMIQGSLIEQWPMTDSRESSVISMACKRSMPDKVQWIPYPSIDVMAFDWSVRPMPGASSYISPLPRRITFGIQDYVAGNIPMIKRMRDMCMHQFNSLWLDKDKGL